METIHISRIFESDRSIFVRRDFTNLREGDILVGKKVSRKGGFPLAVPGCAVVTSREIDSTHCQISWFTGPKSGKAESLDLQDLQRDFDLLPSGDE